MVGRESLSPRVEIFMTEEDALWVEQEWGDDSKQGSSTEGIILLTMLSAQAVLSFEDGPSGYDLNVDEFKIEDLELVESQGDHQIVEVGE